jgi:AraC-like DNA-binding protein
MSITRGADFIEGTLSIWSEAVWNEGDARARLLVWTRLFQDAFDCVHEWPSELVVDARLRESIGRRITIEELTADLPVGRWCGRTSIARAFKRRFGVTISEYHRSLRASEAVRMLRETSWSNECIAQQLGYGSVKNLYSLVRATTGVTPGVLRRLRSGLRAERHDGG